MKREVPKIYSQDLLNNIFMHPYTKVSTLGRELSVQGRTAKKYLDELTRIEILEKKVLHKKKALYINTDLVRLLSGVHKDELI